MKEKQIQISQRLFITLVKCFVLDMEVDCEEIKKELNRKLDAVALRQLYSTYTLLLFICLWAFIENE